jgi:hypothetical protein
MRRQRARRVRLALAGDQAILGAQPWRTSAGEPG